MNAENVKIIQKACPNCGYPINEEQEDINNYDTAIEKARLKLRKELGFGLKEKNETKKRSSKKN